MTHLLLSPRSHNKELRLPYIGPPIIQNIRHNKCILLCVIIALANTILIPANFSPRIYNPVVQNNKNLSIDILTEILCDK